MKPLHIITPVKDSIASTLETAEAILSSDIRTPFTYTIYNDFSTPENTATLEQFVALQGGRMRLVNLADITSHPSPNYLLVLQMTQQRALEEGADLLIIESDVVVRPNTIQALVDGAAERADCGIAASVTVNDQGEINYPYEYARGREGECYAVKRHCTSAARCSQTTCSGRMISTPCSLRNTGST